MKNLKKLLAMGVVAAMGVALLAGCGSSSSSDTADTGTADEGSAAAEVSAEPEETEETEAAATGDGSVYWLNFKPEADEALQDIAATYTDETGVPVTVVTAASGTYTSTLTSEMDKSNPPTLFVVGSASGVETWDDYCLDLTGTDVYNELSTDDFTLYDEDGKACSIGYCYECFGIIVNTDLLGQAGYSLDDITDFDSLKAVADDIHANADSLGFDAFTSSGMDDSSSWRFSGHLANMPLYYESMDDGGWADCPAEIQGTYLDNFKQIWDLYITDCAVDPSTLATGGYDSEAEFCNGEAVFYQNGSWEYDACSSALGDDNIAMIPIYMGVDGEENIGLCCGTENYWAVNCQASEADQQATLDFMYWLVTSDEGTQMMAEQFGEIPYVGAAENPNVFFMNAQEYMDEGKTTVDWTFNLTPNVDDWRAGVVAAMNQYDASLSDDDWANVETAFVQGWAQQYQAAYGE
ncbi:MAG: ABC transporter substrate-binding protein [Clostridiales bacterium]|nr:ABC transporter substrate-binding protein [Clostridiales bacterium]